MVKRVLSSVWLGILASWVGAAVSFGEAPGQTPFDEKQLLVIPEGYQTIEGWRATTFFSPKAPLFVCLTVKDGKFMAFAGDKPTGPFDEVSPPVFSADGTRMVFIPRMGAKTCIVTEQGVGDSYEGSIGTPIFLADGTLTYPAPIAEKKWVVVCGAKRSEEFDQVQDFRASPDGTVPVYRAVKARKSFLVIGDKKGEEFDLIYPPVFSPDGKSVAYPAQVGEKWIIVVDGKRGQEFAQVQPPVWSADSKTVAYGARAKEKWCVVVGETRGEEYLTVAPPTLSFDGKRVAYPALLGPKWCLVVDGKKGEEFDQVEERETTAFTPDGKQVMYVARTGDSWFVMTDDKKSEPFGFVGRPIFSADRKTFAYAAYKDKKGAILMPDRRIDFDGKVDPFAVFFSPNTHELAFLGVVGYDNKCCVAFGKKGATFSYIETVTFSPDEKTIAYRGSAPQDKWHMVLGDKKSDAFEAVGPPIFSADGKKVAFGARKGKEILWKVLAQ